MKIYACLFMSLMAVSLSIADPTPSDFPICTAPASQLSPSIDGEIVVWADYRSGNPDIYGYDFSISTEFQVCTASASQLSPAIGGNIVVWEDSRNGLADIYGYDLSTSTEFPICTASRYQRYPAVSGNIVVWHDDRGQAFENDIYGYDLSTSTEFPICTASASQSYPAISGNIVAWYDYRNGNADIYGYDLSTSTEFPICTASAGQSYPAIDGDTVVWQDARNGGSDIYGYNLGTSTEFSICTDSAIQYSPAISGNIVIWYDARNENSDFNYDIYGYDLSTSTEFAVCTDASYQLAPAISGHTIAWQDERNGNTDIYGIDISARPLATKGGAGMIALGECDCPGIIFGSTDPESALTIFNGGIHINSYNFDEALDILGNAPLTIDTEYIDIVGAFDYRHDLPEGLAVHELLGSEAVVSDPYAYLPDAVYSITPDLGTIADSATPQTYSPGYYSGGIQISNSDVHLQPGDYYLDSIGYPASIQMNGGLLTGEGVTLHIVGNGDEGVEIHGNSNIDISAPTSGPYEGIAIFQKRDVNYDCTQSCAEPWSYAVPISEFNGFGTINIEGVVYMPHNRLGLGGTGDIYTEQVIADRFYIYGTGMKVINHQGERSLLGDFVEPGGVELNDLSYFLMEWLADYDVPADLNYDHRVDLADFAIIAENWSSPGY